MLAKRIIPCLDVKNGKVVKGVRFKNLKVEGDPAELAAFYEKEGADEIVFLDIAASHEKREILLDAVRRTADNISIPFTVGGGIRDLEDIYKVLNAGADKISINTAAVRNPMLIKQAAEVFGSQCVVVAIDAKRKTVKGPQRESLIWEVYIEGGRLPTGLDAVSWAKTAEKLGAGEILLTSMDYDGTQLGYDILLTKTVSQTVNIPVIASGGAGNPEHIYKVLTEGMADAALAASIFHRFQYPIRKVKEYLAKRGVHVRLV
ncbi:MAG TPA: imidazole glycerol phosphate synthase subunit HisF [Candidatus Bathyarchaeota archaeon]|nr:imidazole glycerol phosphate synthase subunit HisF [Candidatus Bathyarchaeota archaeon]HEX69156.1 imidazole glycerol phosphate synthase subunit HisF [Candidatus Bathyarchaeota archaeon]